jgi:hypothetical protein
MLIGFYTIPVAIILQFLMIAVPVIGILFGSLWYQWRHDPSEHKTGMIVTGILGLLLIGIVPGFFLWFRARFCLARKVEYNGNQYSAECNSVFYGMWRL